MRPRTVIGRVCKLAAKCRTERDVTRLWNWIDCQSEPERLWNALMVMAPWGFTDPGNPNSVKFAY